MTIITHDLGLNGTVTEDTDTGMASYRRAMKMMSTFRVKIADVSGVSAHKIGWLKYTVKVFGHGSVLTEYEGSRLEAEALSDLFAELQQRPKPVPPRELLATRESPAQCAEGDSLTGELERLAKLRDRQVLSNEEFVAAKRKLLGLD